MTFAPETYFIRWFQSCLLYTSIYFMSGDKVELIDNLPQVKKVKEKGYEILYLTDNVDEFALQALMNYKEKTFKNISQGDLDLDSEEEKKELEKKAEENKDLLSGIKEVLGLSLIHI